MVVFVQFLFEFRSEQRMEDTNTVTGEKDEFQKSRAVIEVEQFPDELIIISSEECALQQVVRTQLIAFRIIRRIWTNRTKNSRIGLQIVGVA